MKVEKNGVENILVILERNLQLWNYECVVSVALGSKNYFVRTACVVINSVTK